MNGSSTCGGLLWDSHGDLVQNFYCKLGQSIPMMLRCGAWSILCVLSRVIFETETTNVAKMVLNQDTFIAYLKGY